MIAMISSAAPTNAWRSFGVLIAALRLRVAPIEVNERGAVDLTSPMHPLSLNYLRPYPRPLSALFEEFCHYLRVEKEAAPRSIGTYQWCFGDFMAR